MSDLSGKTATLKIPYRGYRNIRIIEPSGHKWLVEICGSGAQITVYDDEFDLDD